MATVKKDTENVTLYTCCKCQKPLDLGKFYYRTFSPWYTTTGFLPMCKNCVNSMADKLMTKYGDKREAMKRVCMAFDLYYSDEIFEKVRRD